MRKHLWAIQLFGLGIWEAAAFLTHRRISTITTTVKAAQARNARLTQGIVGLWLVGLGRHLLK